MLNPLLHDLVAGGRVRKWNLFASMLHNYVIISTSYGLKHIDDLVQDCSNTIANALELLQSCTKPSA